MAIFTPAATALARRLAVDSHHVLRLLQAGLRDLRAVLRGDHHSLGRDQRRHEVSALLQQQGDGLVVEVDAVIDRTDPGPERVFDALGALGVRHDPPPGRGRFGHDRLELVQPEVGVARVVARREHPARAGDLDDVRPIAEQLPDLLADLLGPVDDGVRRARIGLEERDLDPGREPFVAVPARSG